MICETTIIQSWVLYDDLNLAAGPAIIFNIMCSNMLGHMKHSTTGAMKLALK